MASSNTSLHSVIKKLKQFFERAKAEGHSILQENIMLRLELATGLSRTTLYKFLEPEKDKQRKTWKGNFELDDFDKRAIFRKIHQLLAVFRDDLNFTGGRTTPWKIKKKWV